MQRFFGWPVTSVVLFFSMFVVVGALLNAAAHSREDRPSTSVPGGEGVSGQYYSIRPDLRRCAAPLCGGYWISAVNQKTTRCADGTLKPACYVAHIERDALRLEGSEGASLILGRQRQADFPGFGRLGVLIPQAAWRAASDEPARGIWFLVRDSGVRCITTPCYSIRELALNTSKTELISGLDLDRVTAGREDQETALADLYGEGLVVVGSNVVDEGITLVATQFFLQVPSEHGPAAGQSNRFCEKDEDCTTSIYRSFVASREDCYCPLCPEPVNVESARRNQKGWERHCGGFGYSQAGDKDGPLLCPQVKCIAPSPLACVNRRCVFVEQR